MLAETVLDAAAAPETVELLLTDGEKAAAGEILLPAMADLAAVKGLVCGATAYALAQGAIHEDGAVVYWLRDSLENGLHPVISATGSLTLPQEGSTPGIRPMMTINLDQFTFTEGSGTTEDPFRAE